MDDFALEELGSHLDDSIRVGLAFDQPPKELVFAQQVLSLDEVDPQDALRRQRRDRDANMRLEQETRRREDEGATLNSEMISARRKNVEPNMLLQEGN